MVNIAVVYKSRYGTTKQYAEWIAKALDATLLEASAVKPSQLASFDIVIYGGGLYAGGIDGVGLVTKNPCKALVVFTVGLANPNITDYSDILDKNFTQELHSKVKVFHLRGGIDYKKLGFVHKGMMSIMRKSILKKDEQEITAEDHEFLETYDSKVNYIDKNSIEPILAYVRSL